MAILYALLVLLVTVLVTTITYGDVTLLYSYSLKLLSIAKKRQMNINSLHLFMNNAI